MSQAKRPRTSAAPAAASASSGSGVLAVSNRRVVGRRAGPPASSAAASAAASAALVDDSPMRARPIELDAEPGAADEWQFPEPSELIRQLGKDTNAYTQRLTPETWPVFSKYKQEGLDQIVGEVMKFCLQKMSAGQVITHRDITTLLQDRCKGGANYIIADARRRFMELYGYELTELSKLDITEKKRKSTAASNAAAGGSKTYILRTPNFSNEALRRGYADFALRNADGEEESAASDARNAKRGLLFFLFALIHAEESAQGSADVHEPRGCAESRMWRILHKYAGIDRDMKNHPIFGHVAAYVDELVKQHYLAKVKITHESGGAASEERRADQYTYRIGQRGLAEISNQAVYYGLCEDILGVPPSEAHLKQLKRNEDLAKGKVAAEPASKPAAAAAVPA